MAFKKSNITNITEEKLEWLIKNQSLLSDVSKDIDDKIINQLKDKCKHIESKKTDKINLLNNYKFVFIASCIFIMIITGLFSYFFYNLKKRNMIACKLEKMEGKILINGRYIKINKNKLILKNQTIMTENNSSIDLKIGYNSTIKINELSKIKIEKFSKFKNDEFSRIYLNKGSIICNVTLPTADSRFEIMTNNNLFTVKGTIFNLTINEKNEITLNVEKGIVKTSNLIKEKLNLKKIKDNYKDIYEQLIDIIDYKIDVKENESLKLNNRSIEEYNKKLLNLVSVINENIKNKNIDENNKTDLIVKIKNLDNQKNYLYSYKKIEDNKSNEEKFIINEIPLKLGINFSEYDTAITSDNNRYCYISSDKNKAVYCIDLVRNILKWKFSNKLITNISSPAVSYKSKVIIATPNMIFILNESGKKIFSKEIQNGTSYWAYPEIFNDILYIPTFNTIYTYNGNNLGILSDKIETNGQIYISYFNNNIYYSILNEKKIKEYSIKENKLVWESDIFKERSFIPPVIVGQNIYIADVKGNIYNYDLKNNFKREIKIDYGIISKLIYHEDYLYFIALDGYFYRIETNSFNKTMKLYPIDNKPNKDKYLTKKMFLKDNNIYYCSDTGKLFIYSIMKSIGEFISIRDNVKNSTLIGSPVEVGENIIIIDSESNIYKITK